MVKKLRGGIIFGIVIMLVTMGFVILPMNSSLGVSEEKIRESIDLGIEWLASQQNNDEHMDR